MKTFIVTAAAFVLASLSVVNAAALPASADAAIVSSGLSTVLTASPIGPLSIAVDSQRKDSIAKMILVSNMEGADPHAIPRVDVAYIFGSLS
ncbi:hypothetical protein B0H17DRAFT_1219196 [Mycena rosella]|uniref:Uncharacterized protein n=1 Tax=Mycena rosella TaxID=1033263 RepID=A0AAD7BJ53_MYCRO|nr:hypothetical protein B0H17DRAFT_1219196 [Mycena rosella]